MKNYLIYIALCFSPLFSQAQNHSVKAFYDKYMDKENVTDISLQGWVLQMAAEFSDEEDGKDILERITRLRVMVMEDRNIVTASDYNSLVRNIQKDKFELLMNVRDGNDKIDFFLQEKDGKISNVLMLVNGSDEFVLISLEGNLRFEDLKKLNFETEGGEKFKHLKKHKKEPRA